MKFQLNGSLALYHLLSGLRPICLLLLVGVTRGVQLEQFIARRGHLLCDMPHTVLVGVQSCPSVGAFLCCVPIWVVLRSGFVVGIFFRKRPGHLALFAAIAHFSLDMQGQPPLPPVSFGFFGQRPR